MNHRRWTTDEEVWLTKHYENTTAAQCARILGRGESSVAMKALTLGLRKDLGRQDAAVAVALEKAGRPGGVRCHELGVPTARGHQVLNRMAHDGRLFRLRISHKHVRFFLNAKAAQRYCTAERVAPPMVTVKHRPGVAWWKPDAPTNNPNNVQPQICPSPSLGLHTSWGCGINSLMAW